MKRAKNLILPVLLAAMLIAPQAAVAASRTAAAERQLPGIRMAATDPAAMQAPPHDGCKDGKCKFRHRGDEAAFRVYSMMTGKTVESLKKTCAEGELTIWQLAKNDGKLDALKAKLLDVKSASLNELVKGGVMTDEERDKILAHVKEEMDRK